MGDIGTHFDISKKVRALLEAARPGEQYIFIEIGNWLTDFSQFKDPTAYTEAKSTIWQRAREQKGALRVPWIADLVIDLDGYLDRLFGRPEGPARGGVISVYMRELIFALTLEIYRRPPFSVDPDELQRVYDAHFSQYFPHEHLDFPPGEGGSLRGDASTSPRAKHTCGAAPSPGTRQILKYLDDEIEYVANLLSLVEKRWVQTAPSPAVSSERHELLARYGHASHAVEDFFFHSNVMEMGWNKLGFAPPTDRPPPDEVGPPPADPRQDDFGPVRLERLYRRRQRSPVFDGIDLSTTTSSPAAQVFTGFFGHNDVNHTLIDAIDNLQRAVDEAFAAHPEGAAGQDVAVTVVQNAIGKVFDPDPTHQADNLKQHRQDLDDGRAYAELGAMLASGQLHQKSYDALVRAYDLDRDLGHEFSVGGNHWGVFGMLQLVCAAARTGEDQSRTVSRQLDVQHVTSDARSHIPGEAGTIGAAAEDVGSHSLMAKDSVREPPLRHPAVSVATRVAVYIAEQMVSRIQASSGGSPANGLDWLHLLQHFLAHPDEAEGADATHPWWLAPAQEPNATDSGPTFHVPRFVDQAELSRRAGEPTKQQLEALYTSLEIGSEKAWRGLVDRQFILDSGIWGAILNGLEGAIAMPFLLPANHRSTGDIFAAIGLGLVVGGALGFAGVALLTWLGTLLGSGTGAVVAMLIALAGTLVATPFTSKAVAAAVFPAP